MESRAAQEEPGLSAGEDVYLAEPVGAPLRRPTLEEAITPRKPRVVRPVILFLLTCLSTFWVGATLWRPNLYFVNPETWPQGAFPGDEGFMPLRRAVVANWEEGLVYMLCVIGILLAHEMGHYVATLIYRVPASLPHFIPFPIQLFGTMGAVIAMDGRRADRKQIFDIGIAGPLAGLAICIPVAFIGAAKLDFDQPQSGGYVLDLPYLMVLFLSWTQPESLAGYQEQGGVWVSQLNPYFMAGWFGLVVTAINMAPVSQLDGGHVIYTLFGPKAKWIARAFVLFAVTYIVFAGAYVWAVMLFLVVLMGVDHPPTANDQAKLGWGRIVLGLASLSIPFLCFPPRMLTFVGM
jgi:membrane-associated protease RseP (regulator of RpoE activity)